MLFRHLPFAVLLLAALVGCDQSHHHHLGDGIGDGGGSPENPGGGPDSGTPDPFPGGSGSAGGSDTVTTRDIPNNAQLYLARGSSAYAPTVANRIWWTASLSAYRGYLWINSVPDEDRYRTVDAHGVGFGYGIDTSLAPTTSDDCISLQAAKASFGMSFSGRGLYRVYLRPQGSAAPCVVLQQLVYEEVEDSGEMGEIIPAGTVGILRTEAPASLLAGETTLNPGMFTQVGHGTFEQTVDLPVGDYVYYITGTLNDRPITFVGVDNFTLGIDMPAPLLANVSNRNIHMHIGAADVGRYTLHMQLDSIEGAVLWLKKQ